MNRHLLTAPSWRPSRRVLALGAAGVLALAACGGDDDAGTSATAAAATTTAAPDAPVNGENQIVISGFAFSGVTEVPVGTTVTVINEDTAAHTWTAIDGAFDSEGLAPGDSFEFTFEEPGTFDYRCNIHTSMTGTIVVTP